MAWLLVMGFWFVSVFFFLLFLLFCFGRFHVCVRVHVYDFVCKWVRTMSHNRESGRGFDCTSDLFLHFNYFHIHFIFIFQLIFFCVFIHSHTSEASDSFMDDVIHS